MLKSSFLESLFLGWCWFEFALKSCLGTVFPFNFWYHNILLKLILRYFTLLTQKLPFLVLKIQLYLYILFLVVRIHLEFLFVLVLVHLVE